MASQSNRFGEIKTHSYKLDQSKDLQVSITSPLNRSNYDSDFPALPSTNSSSKDCASKACMLSLEELKMIQVKNRTPEETKRYRHLMYLKRKEKNVDQHTSVALGSLNKDNTNNDIIKCT